MCRWKWFHRPDEPLDVVERTSFPARTGAYRLTMPPSSTGKGAASSQRGDRDDG
jgi:hypothetical protein